MVNLLDEDEILGRVQSDWTKPLVTFLCFTYNQEDYIEQTIRGFLEQKTSFPYEILIHDDSSTDGTKDIIESYRLKYPHIIRCIYQAENQYSQGISPSIIVEKECKSDYVALCEGDDYWINENKIENQFKLMLSDDSISMIVSPGKLERDGKILSDLHCYYGSENKNITAQDILNVASQFAPTASYFVKKSYLVNATDAFIDAPVGDLFIELYSAVFGRVVYLPEVSSVYRAMAKNSFSEKSSIDGLKNCIRIKDSMQKTIEQSRSIKGFDRLDWSIKLAAMHSDIALLYLKNKEVEKFKEMINISHSYSSSRFSQKVIFSLRNYTILFPFTVYPAISLKNKFRVFFKKN